MSLPTPVSLTTQSTPVTRAASHGFFGEGANYGAGNHHSPRLCSRGRAALLSRASCTSCLAAPPLATCAPAHACGLQHRLGPSGAAEGATMFDGGTVMGNDFTICVGTIGSGIWRSPDGGETWSRVRPSRYPENDVRARAVPPRAPHRVYAGTDSGVYRSEDRGASWERLDAPMNAMQTWALAIDPVVPDIIFAGTKPPAVFRSRDGGQQWDNLGVELAADGPGVG